MSRLIYLNPISREAKEEQLSVHEVEVGWRVEGGRRVGIGGQGLGRPALEEGTTVCGD